MKLENLLSVQKFAKAMDVSDTAVYDKIKAGEIKPVIICEKKYIDFEKYSQVKFKAK